jgi:hypothetical protein
VSDIDLAYCAGMLDVAGQIGLNNDKGSMRPCIRLRRSERGALDLLQQMFGGRVRAAKSGFSLWVWEIHGVAARNAIATLKPYLRQRQQEALRVLMWRPKPTGPRRPVVQPGSWAGMVGT